MTRSHSRMAKTLHWGFIAVFIFALTKQLDEVEELEDAALLQYEMIFASVFLLLLIGRFLYMQLTVPSVLPRETPRQITLLARAVHLGMYAGMALIALSGMAIGLLYGAGEKSGPGMDLWLLVHEIAVNGSFTLIFVHIAAALYHRRRRDGLWDAMVPFWPEKKKSEEPA